MLTINVRNIKRYKGEGFYIGRPSTLSNPFKIEGNMTRTMSIEKYGLYIIEKIKENDSEIIAALEQIRSHLIEHGKCDLICYCAPKACHGDIIAQLLLNKVRTDQWLVEEQGEYKIGVYGI